MRYAAAIDQTPTKKQRKITRSHTETEELYNFRTGRSDHDISEEVQASVKSRLNEGAVEDLIERWEREILNSSGFDEMCESKYFNGIVGFGSDAVPVLLRRIEKRHSWVVLALDELTEDQPYPDDAFGDLDQICSEWLRWGSAKSLI